jgi:hypothetical protein
MVKPLVHGADDGAGASARYKSVGSRGHGHRPDIWTGLLPISTHCYGRDGGAGSRLPPRLRLAGLQVVQAPRLSR